MLLFHLTFVQYSNQISMKTSFSHYTLQTSNNSTKQKTQFNSLNKSTKSFFHLIISTQQIFFFFSSTLFLQSITNTNTFFDHSKLFTNIHNNTNKIIPPLLYLFYNIFSIDPNRSHINKQFKLLFSNLIKIIPNNLNS